MSNDEEDLPVVTFGSNNTSLVCNVFNFKNM
jgi:hypothetical protein